MSNFAIFLAAVFGTTALAVAQPQRCEDLTRLALPNITIRLAKTVPAGAFHLPRRPADAPPVSVPQFCRVVGVVKPELNFEVWLPAQWNRKYIAVGNSGLAGSLVYNGMLDPLNRGYATSSTDTGHTGVDTNDGAWALGHLDRVINFGQRGVHQMALAAKAVIRAYYGAPPAHSYFSGCSYGGKQALTEVQAYPADFDGVVAGDPSNFFTRHYAAHIWFAQTLDDDAYIPAAKIPLIANAVNAACDALDGIKDGVLNDPRRCHYDPAALACRGGDAPNCLTGAQADAVRKIWDGLRDAGGQQLYPGIERGGEAGPGGWKTWMTGNGTGQGAHVGLGTQFMKYVVFENPDWDYRTFRFTAPPGLENDLEYTQDKIGRIFDAIDPDLRAFRGYGGKLLQYHGWNDPDIPAGDSINYYESVARRMGGVEDTKDFHRLFLIPGMQHCGDGPGTSHFDSLTALEQWVEQSKPPEQMTGYHVTNGQVDRTRPLCAYPQEAHYKGTGSTDDAANFVCTPPIQLP